MTVAERIPQSPASVAPRLLLVDDRRDNLLAVSEVLAPLGYELLTASSGPEALRILLDQAVSAIVLDVQMPDMDGFETAELIRSRAATRTIPILFLTAVGNSREHELRGYAVGGVDYICKPFEPALLQAKVRSIVGWSGELRELARLAQVYEESGAALASSLSGAEQEPGAGPEGAEPRPFVAMRRLLDVSLPADLGAPSKARAAVRAALSGQPADLCHTIELLVSELVTNAVLHARSTATVRIDAGPAVVRVEVEDTGMRLPDAALGRQVDVTEETGRGLQLVGRLVDRFGWTGLADGKVVWFELGTTSR